MYIKNITDYIESWAPITYQESYDNSGLLIGNKQNKLTGVLLTLDVLPDILEEAKANNCNLVVTHHPIIFKGLKQLNGYNYVEKTVIKAIKNDLAIYAAHTNLDNVHTGVNKMITQKLRLENTNILKPKSDNLLKLSTTVPLDHVDKVSEAIGNAGAGKMGNYSHCTFQTQGKGTFRPNSDAKPFIGQTNHLEMVKEAEITTILPSHLKNKVLVALKDSHPYEEVSYFFEYLANNNQDVGSGMIGTLPESMEVFDFLKYIQEAMCLDCIRYTKDFKGVIKTVAVCGGSGRFLLPTAIQKKADAFVTSDFKYHEFFDAEDKLMVADIGHYESEIFTKDLLKDKLQRAFPNLSLFKSKVSTNPIKYFHK